MTDTPPKRRPGRPSRANTGATPQRNIRMADDRWQAFGEATEALGLDRTEVLNRFVAWFTRERGANAVKRPSLVIHPHPRWMTVEEAREYVVDAPSPERTES